MSDLEHSRLSMCAISLGRQGSLPLNSGCLISTRSHTRAMTLANCEPCREALFEGFKTPGKQENCQLLFKPPGLNYFAQRPCKHRVKLGSS